MFKMGLTLHNVQSLKSNCHPSLVSMSKVTHPKSKVQSYPSRVSKSKVTHPKSQIQKSSI